MNCFLQINEDGSFRLEHFDPNFTVLIQPDGYGLVYVRVNKIGCPTNDFDSDEWECTFGDKNGVEMMQWISGKKLLCTV